MTSLLALGTSGGVAAGLTESGSAFVALPCGSARRSRLFPAVFDDCSCIGRRLSLRERAIIRVNETVFALNFLETGGIAYFECLCKSDKKMFFTAVLGRLHSNVEATTRSMCRM